jgi:hypothetical protein
MKKIIIELTEDEAEVVDNYIFRKMCRLEDAHLEESFCYPNLASVHRKIQRAKDEQND